MNKKDNSDVFSSKEDNKKEDVLNDHSSHLAENDQVFILSNKVSSPLFKPEIDMTWLFLIGLAASLRIYNLSTPKAVVFDEVHFGKFISYFMKNRFFFDVHPPLGKLLYAAAGYFSGFDGSFEFDKIGQEIPPNQIHHVYVLRLVPSLFSVFLVPVVYEIILELGCTYWFAVLGGVLICFDNMLVVQSKFILLDSIMLFFIAFSICCYIKFVKEYTRPFCFYWWVYLVSLGISLTATFSIKYNGFLTILLLGGIIAYEMWIIMGDVTVPAKSVIYHMLARTGCLVVLPLFLYIVQFYILLNVLYKSGPHDNLMSSAFQRTLEGGLSTITQNQAEVVAYGSQITLRNTHSKQCWLHSHQDLYPIKYPDGRGSSAQQQVTCYAFKDVNNWWIVKHPDSDNLMTDFPPRPVKNGDIIHLVHGTTGRGLNSHDVAAPLNPQFMEVSGYIDHNVSMDAQLGFRLQILNADSSNIWKAIESKVRFVHVNTTASLRVTGQLLPDWGFHQYEVATDRMVNTEESIWNVEEHNQNISLPSNMTEEEARAILANQNHIEISDMTFFQKFWELQTQMFKVNSMITQEHVYASRPFEWPIMKRGIAYWIDTKSNRQIFCIGNPFVWWLGCLAIMVYLFLMVVYLLRRQRAIYDITNVQWNLFLLSGYLLVGGYFLNFLFFVPMERTLFIHHYLPSLLFKIILIPVIANHLNNVLLKDIKILQILFKYCCFIYLLAMIWSYNYFSVFTYGTLSLSRNQINDKKWLQSWDFLSHDGL
ncbi:protein O-mannosyl-transferase 1 isoform X1 [Hydra vulgaris]|uniref:protein O-mannosyl-transferase 1 isoform X1 n=1 Tax=Hydra vulgaris TaxID=6087 RepID=UPI001F5EE5B9|nr:protein O-mannosyl-transferase 1 [Hydra vulgaris]